MTKKKNDQKKMNKKKKLTLIEFLNKEEAVPAIGKTVKINAEIPPKATTQNKYNALHKL